MVRIEENAIAATDHPFIAHAIRQPNAGLPDIVKCVCVRNFLRNRGGNEMRLPRIEDRAVSIRGFRHCGQFVSQTQRYRQLPGCLPLIRKEKAVPVCRYSSLDEWARRN